MSQRLYKVGFIALNNNVETLRMHDVTWYTMI